VRKVYSREKLGYERAGGSTTDKIYTNLLVGVRYLGLKVLGTSMFWEDQKSGEEHFRPTAFLIITEMMGSVQQKDKST
jgi:hypothetical protein